MKTGMMWYAFVVAFAFNVPAAIGQVSKPAKDTPPKQAKESPEKTSPDAVQNMRLEWLEAATHSNNGTLDCRNGGFDTFVMRSPKLVLFASCKNIEPYLEGHRLTVQIGNPHTFSFGGISGKIAYGKDWATNNADITFAGSIQPGKWTEISVTISPSKPEDLRNLYISLSAKTVGPMW